MLRRIWAVMQKELIQILRDRRTLLIQVSMPMIQLFLFGYAINMSVDHIPMVVVDRSLDAASHAYVDALVTSGFFDVVGYLSSEAEMVQAIDQGHAQAGIVIPPGFAADVASSPLSGMAHVLLLIDGSDLFTSQSAYNAATLIAEVHAADVLMTKVERSGRAAGQKDLLPFDARVRILYNPNLDDLWFLIPGMAAMLLQIQSIALTAMSIVRERERGNIEQILVTPIRSAELMIGKMMPAALIVLINLMTILAVGVFWFEVPFQGDFWLFLWLAFMYVFSGLGLGLLASTISQNQKQAHQVIGVIALVGIVLAGFIFPRYAMPPLIRVVGNLFPMTYFVPIAQGIITKGVGIEYLWDQVAALLIYVIVVLVFAIRLFKPALD